VFIWGKESWAMALQTQLKGFNSILRFGPIGSRAVGSETLATAVHRLDTPTAAFVA
jgi:hypothetical protein